MRVLLAQCAPAPGDLDANVERMRQVVGEHPTVDLAVFPELFLGGYDVDAAPRLAVSLDDPRIARIRQLAGARRTALVVGFAERLEDGGCANSALCVDIDGSIARVHRKTHLFGDGEREAFTAGGSLHVVPLAGRRIAPLICFEVEFPELARAVARAGVDLLVTVAANMTEYADDHELATRARALDNRLAHLYVNRVGHEAGLEFGGGSKVVDRAGQVLASAGRSEATVPAELAVDGRVPDDIDYLSRLRPDLEVCTP